MLRHMSPSLASPNIGYRLLANSKLRGNGSLCSAGCANCENLVCGEFGADTGVNLSTRGTSLRDTISSVLCVGPKPQVSCVPAWRVVTGMADLFPSRDRAVGLFPCQAMYAARFSLPPKSTVASRISIPRPRPAGVWTTALVGVVVEALRKRPMTRDIESFRRFGSHLTALLWRSVVRAGIALTTRFRPAFSIKNCALAKGVSP